MVCGEAIFIILGKRVGMLTFSQSRNVDSIIFGPVQTVVESSFWFLLAFIFYRFSVENNAHNFFFTGKFECKKIL